MQLSIKKWGDSLAIRLPTTLAKDMGLQDGALVDLSVTQGGILIRPQKSTPKYDLASLLDQITDENLHAEVGTGEPVGNEAW